MLKVKILTKQKKNMSNGPLVCLPGQRLSTCDQTYTCGQGTYQRQGYIYSMLAGTVDIVDRNGVKVVEVHSSGEQTVIPAQGDIVTAQVITKIPHINRVKPKETLRCM